jgi:hypothetical protein
MADFSGSAIISFGPPPGLDLPGEEKDSLYDQFPNLAWNSALYPAEDQHNVLDVNNFELNLDQAPITNDQGEVMDADLDPVSSNKEVRKLEKKLRDISKLETKVAAGEKVDPLQLKKIEKKEALQDELIALRDCLTNEMREAEKQSEDPGPPPGFDKLPADKLASLSNLRAGAFAMDACEDDATTLPGSTASDQGGDSDSESQVSELRTRQLSAHAPVFVPQAQQAFVPMMAMPFVPMDMGMVRTPLKNTAALFTPANSGTGGHLSKDAPVFIPTSFPASEPEAAEPEKVTWRSTRSKMSGLPEEKDKRTKLTAGSAELFVPQFPDLKASLAMKCKEKVKGKKTTQV